MSDVVILGGPNGAGKTTAAQSLLPSEIEVSEFVNADEIARALSPQNSEYAALAAGRTHARYIERCKVEGWRVVLLFLWLPSVEAAIERVNRRIALGGHAIPPDVIARRYKAGIANMRDIYLPLADIAAIYDNSDKGRTLIAEQIAEAQLNVHNADCWAQIESMS
jgi:predicted ABC-type ATPase